MKPSNMDKPAQDHLRWLGWWLMVCAATVYLMVVVGGITRLTQSGLSMVEWQPLMGFLPPLNEVEWQRVFFKYQQYPEYQLINHGMSLEEFKSIFWWEFIHRVLGRLIGVIYFLPLVFFWIKGTVPSRWKFRLMFLFFLGGMQGMLGWYMVKSGLVDMPHVSQYRLTAHLGLAILIFALMLWFALEFLRGESPKIQNKARRSYLFLTALLVVIVFVMILSGGFVAGTKAGFIMNTFPTMNGEWLPSQVMSLQPMWKNLFENPVTIQFTHRLFAIVVLFSVLMCCVDAKNQPFKTGVVWLALIVAMQLMLGGATLLMRVPVVLGAAHQAGAVALLASAIFVAHRARREKK